jgi:uncharacterized repeat protein (TIGR03803 family)
MRFCYVGIFCVVLAGCSGVRSTAPTVPVVPVDGMAHGRQSASAIARESDASSYSTVWSFLGGVDGPHGAYPLSSLVAVNGTLYGTTGAGGESGFGCVFSLTTAGKETLLYNFGPTPDAQSPTAGLTEASGMLYGVGAGGEFGNGGAVFAISPSGAERVIHSFGSGDDGWGPQSVLVNENGTLYGTTISAGHDTGHGTVFRLSTGGAESVLYHFKGGADGQGPTASVIDVGGALYGTTFGGGKYGHGTVFKLTLSGTHTVLYSFKGGADGDGPVGGVLGLDGSLYGTTYAGGQYCKASAGCGTVFKVSMSGAETVLHSFGQGDDGVAPYANLIEVNGTLYGTTFYGGRYSTAACAYSCGGTVFKITPSGSESVLHSFGNGTDGENPEAALVDVNGVLYSTTDGGGTYGYGTVFAIAP